MQDCSSSGWHPQRTAEIAPGAYSPVIAPAIFYLPRLYAGGIRESAHFSFSRDDGLRLINSYITATARCAPPDNKPLPSEILNCRGYMEREIRILEPKAVLALGRIAWDAYLEVLKQQSLITSRTPYRFAHGAEIQLPPPAPRLFGVYHPSQQNTQTGKVTPAMYAEVLTRIRKFLGARG